jgi:hypothetical protein
MQTPDIFEQIAHGMGNPKKISQWLKGGWPISANGKAVTAETKAWIGSVESLLHSAEALRHLQLDAIHKTQKRTSRLAKSLGEAHSPADTVTALQAFAQENMQDALQYWAVYHEIVEDAELQMLGGAGEPAGNGGAESHGKIRTPAPRQKRARAAQGKASRVA